MSHTDKTELVVNDRRASDADLPAPRGSTPMEMLAAAINRNMPVETLDKLLTLQERWEKNETRKAFDAAMAAAKAEIPTISKNRTVDFTSQKGRTHYRHEDLGEIARTVDPILAKHGLSYRFRTTSEPNQPITVACIIAHAAGYQEVNTLSAGRDESGNKNAIQSIGSTITYLQRYTLKAALGLAASLDDDGAATGADAEAPAFDPEPWLDRIDAAFDGKDKAAAAAIRDELAAAAKVGNVPKHAQDIIQG
ncbi:MAG: ERF family protein, partial [Parvularculaceae bacterium]